MHIHVHARWWRSVVSTNSATSTRNRDSMANHLSGGQICGGTPYLINMNRVRPHAIDEITYYFSYSDETISYVTKSCLILMSSAATEAMSSPSQSQTNPKSAPSQ